MYEKKKSKKIYRRRRIAALCAVLVLLAGIGYLVVASLPKTVTGEFTGIVVRADGAQVTLEDRQDPTVSFDLLLGEEDLAAYAPEVNDLMYVSYSYKEKDPQPYSASVISFTKAQTVNKTFHGEFISCEGDVLTLSDREEGNVSVDISGVHYVPTLLEAGDELYVDVEYIDTVPVIPYPASVVIRIDYRNDGFGPLINEGENPLALKDGDITSKGYKVRVIDGVTYVDGILIANKTYVLPSYYNTDGLTKSCYAAFKEMQSAAAKDGIDLFIVSGFRSYETQYIIYNRYVGNDGVAAADTYSARPGHSEHQSGLAMDINSLKSAWADTPEGKWLAANAHKYGFIVRYPKGKSDITGYIYEPWHIRYLGTDLATTLYESGLTVEEYFGITSSFG